MSVLESVSTTDRWISARESFRTILMHVEPQAPAQRRLAGAVALARRLDATLIGLCAEVVQPLQFVDTFGLANAGWVEEAAKLVGENLQRSAEIFRAKTADISSVCVTAQDFPVPAAVDLSGGVDLIVAGGFDPVDRDSYRWCDPAELAIKSGLPVLVLPNQGGALDIGRILVAWKNTREARRAIADALPFMKGADQVVVASVYDDGEEAEARAQCDAVVRRLIRHNVKAEAQLVLSTPALVPAVLQRCASDLDADLIVSGAYGHTRLGEWAFGGVTRSMLETGDRHLLISH